MLALKYVELVDGCRSDGIEGYRLCCILCGAEERNMLRYRCFGCGGALDTIHDLSDTAVCDSPEPLQRYFSLLPLRNRSVARWLGEGNTDCIHAEYLGKQLRMDALFLKDETTNPTRSTKDRVASVALARFSELGVRRLALASTGNTSTAYARAARLLGGFTLHIFVGRRFLPRLNYHDHPTVRTYVLESGFDSADEAAKQFAAAAGVTFEGGFFNPGRREGLKLTYLEAFDQMPVSPRYVFQAVSSGMGLLAAYKGGIEYRALGRLSAIPRFIAVQQDSCSPMVSAFAEGAQAIGSHHIVPEPAGIAEAILRGDPTQSFPYVNAVCRASGGLIMSATTDEIRNAGRLLMDLEGLRVCHSSATALAGVITLRQRGVIHADTPVLVNLTGTDRPYSPVPCEVIQYGEQLALLRTGEPTLDLSTAERQNAR